MKAIQQWNTRVLTHEGHTENRERGSENRERERGWREGKYSARYSKEVQDEVQIERE